MSSRVLDDMEGQELMQLETLMYMHDAVSNDREVEGLIERITKVAYTVLDAESISVLLLSKDKKRLVSVGSEGGDAVSAHAARTWFHP
jgi:hypothetical protein